MSRPLVLAITGASGAPVACRLLRVLAAAADCEVHLTISPSGAAVLGQEMGVEVALDRFRPATLLAARPPWHAGGSGPESSAVETAAAGIHYHHYQDFMTPIASGSFLTGGMVVCPCSGSTLSGIAHAASGNLIERAADVHLKEGRKLIVVPRETPLSTLQLENMQRVAAAGGVVLPAMPGWYHGVGSVDDLVDFLVARILDQLGLDNTLMSRWGEPAGDAEPSNRGPSSQGAR